MAVPPEHDGTPSKYVGERQFETTAFDNADNELRGFRLSLTHVVYLYRFSVRSFHGKQQFAQCMGGGLARCVTNQRDMCLCSHACYREGTRGQRVSCMTNHTATVFAKVTKPRHKKVVRLSTNV